MTKRELRKEIKALVGGPESVYIQTVVVHCADRKTSMKDMKFLLKPLGRKTLNALVSLVNLYQDV